MTQTRSAVSVLAAALLLSACSREAPAPEAQPATAAPATVVAPAIAYVCESGKTVIAEYPDTASARVTYEGQGYALTSVPAGSGARYAGSGFEWSTATRNGQETALLGRAGPSQGVDGTILERCARQGSIATPAMSQPVAPTPAPGGVLQAALPCKSGQLKLSTEGGDAGMGHRVTTLGVQNTSSQACSITGYPGVSLLDARGRGLTTIRVDKHPGSYLHSGQDPTPVELSPQGKGYFDLAWTVVPNEGAGETVCPTATTVRFTAPGDTATTSFALNSTPCGGRIDVSPVRPTTEDAAPA